MQITTFEAAGSCADEFGEGVLALAEQLPRRFCFHDTAEAASKPQRKHDPLPHDGGSSAHSRRRTQHPADFASTTQRKQRAPGPHSRRRTQPPRRFCFHDTAEAASTPARKHDPLPQHGGSSAHSRRRTQHPADSASTTQRKLLPHQRGSTTRFLNTVEAARPQPALTTPHPAPPQILLPRHSGSCFHTSAEARPASSTRWKQRAPTASFDRGPE